MVIVALWKKRDILVCYSWLGDRMLIHFYPHLEEERKSRFFVAHRSDICLGKGFGEWWFG